MVTDHNGVVILTSRPQWRFRATRPLTAEERQAIIAIQPYPTRDPQPLSLSSSAWLRQSTAIAETGWNVEILAPRSLINRPVRTVVAVGGATLLVLMLLLGLLMQRRRHYLERIAFEAKARRELEMRELRQAGCKMPVLMVSALSEVDARVEGLNAGADDYLAKPFAMIELCARFAALSRRPPLSSIPTSRSTCSCFAIPPASA